ncbi:MAG: glycosyltransferase family 4 protein [Chloroflexi bacterium]|nr:glycosyltransferase family 4 protein [Chloroflexota bacterium]
MRVAIFSPLTPVKSAISDYTEGLLPHLAKSLDLCVVTKGDYQPTNPLFTRDDAPIPWMSYQEFKRRSAEFDMVVYQLGDEATIHGYMFDALERYPGLVVMHDLILHHAICGLTLGQSNPEAYIAEMRYSYGDEGERMAREVIAGRGEQIVNHYPLVERVLDNSLGVIGHNNYVCSHITALRPELPVRRIFQHFFLPEGFPEDFDGAAYRKQLGLDGRPVIASFGFFIPDKRLGLVLRAFKRLLARHPDALYLLVGGTSPYYNFQEEMAAVGLSRHVRLTGWLTPVPFVKYMYVPDLAIHLRYPHIGGTPYTPIRLLGLGVPTITSDIEPLAELPANGVVRITPNEPDEEAMLFAAMDYLLTRRDVALTMAENGQRHVLEHHAIDTICDQYVQFIQDVAAQQQDRLAEIRNRRGTTHESFPDCDLAALTRIAGGALADMGVSRPSDRLLLPVAQAIRGLAKRNV